MTRSYITSSKLLFDVIPLRRDPGPMNATTALPVTIRPACPDDDPALWRLAALDSSSVPARPDDRPLPIAALHRPIGLRLRLQIHAEHLFACRRSLGAHRADDQVARRPGQARRFEQLDCTVAVHGQLARGSGAGTGAGGEHDRIGAIDRRCDLLGARLLEVTYRRRCALSTDLASVIWVPDQADHLLAALA